MNPHAERIRDAIIAEYDRTWGSQSPYSSLRMGLILDARLGPLITAADGMNEACKLGPMGNNQYPAHVTYEAARDAAMKEATP